MRFSDFCGCLGGCAVAAFSVVEVVVISRNSLIGEAPTTGVFLDYK